MGKLLIVDDEPAICWGLKKLAESLGHTVQTAASAEEGIELAGRERLDALVLDVRLPGMDGLTAMQEFRSRLAGAPIIIITAYGDLQTAVDAVRGGAFEYLIKPFELKVVERVLERALAHRQEATAAAPQPATPWQLDGLVGRTPAMQQVFKQVALVSASDACVQLCGASGTGKELVARAIHRYSARAAGPFVAVNVASLSESVAESELFGHVRGAFTGAAEARRGLLEQADGGTIFLDEVADIPLSLQVKLLRALEHGEVLPVGGTNSVRADFRVISATHQDLAARVRTGQFRHDLFFRLNTFEIRLPALDERREDIVELADYFLGVFAQRGGVPCPVLSAAAREQLEQRPWSGNVRELRNTIEHAMVVARGGVILPEHLPPAAITARGEQHSPEQTIAAALRDWADGQWPATGEADAVYERLLALVEPPVLQVALEKHGGQRAAAARSLGLHRITLRKKLQQFGLE